MLFLVLSSTIAVDILKYTLIGAPTALERDISIAQQGLGIYQFNDRLVSFADTVKTYFGGAYANIIILGLGLYWLIRCSIRDLSSVFVMICLSSVIIPLFLGDYVLQTPVLYNVPFIYLLPIGLFAIWNEKRKMIFVGIIANNRLSIALFSCELGLRSSKATSAFY